MIFENINKYIILIISAIINKLFSPRIEIVRNEIIVTND